MAASWVVRWDTRREEAPSVLCLGDDDSLSVLKARSGSFAVLDGYLFEKATLHPDSSESDAAVLLSAYQRWGEGLFDRIRGGFAIVIWDHENRRLLVGRDALGLTPCFYHWNDHVFIASSSLDAILAQPEVDASFNRVVLAEHVQDFYPPHQQEETCYEYVRRVRPAHLLTVASSLVRCSRYWDPLPPGFAWAGEEELSQFQPMLERAVSRCLSAGADSLGLSGGFDSVSIAILAAEQLRGRRPLQAVSLRFTHTTCDESDTQTRVARALGMPLLLRSVEECLDGGNCVEGSLALSKDSPSPVLSPWQAIYTGLLKSAAAPHVRRLLMGTGGDDIFNVDFTYGADCLAAFDLRALWRFYRCWQRASPFSAAVVARVVLWDGAVIPETRRLASSVLGRISPRAMEWLRRRSRRPTAAWTSPADKDLKAALEYRRWHRPVVESAPGERAYVRTIQNLTQAPLLLLELDQAMSWADHCGITLLYPYFDRDLVDLVLRIHPEHLIAGGKAKAPLRRMVAERLPQVEMRSKKVDFAEMVHQVLRPGGRAVWQELGELSALEEMGIVAPDLLVPLMEDYFAGRHHRWNLVWQVLSAEVWLRARSAGPCSGRQVRQLRLAEARPRG